MVMVILAPAALSGRYQQAVLHHSVVTLCQFTEEYNDNLLNPSQRMCPHASVIQYPFFMCSLFQPSYSFINSSMQGENPRIARICLYLFMLVEYGTPHTLCCTHKQPDIFLDFLCSSIRCSTLQVSFQAENVASWQQFPS